MVPILHCRHCAAVYNHVGPCIGCEDKGPDVIAERHTQGLHSTDYYSVRACTSSDGTPADQLRLIACHLHGWRAQNGAPGPC